MEGDPQGTSLVLQLLLIVFLTLINAYFAASEMAIVSVNRTRIQRMVKEGNKKAKLVEQLLNEPTAFLSTIQVAITLAGFFNSASAATGISKKFAGVLEQWAIPYGDTIAMVVITILLSFVTLIFGELVPKRIALQNAEKYSMFCVRPIICISKVASPFIKVLSWSTKMVLKLFGMHDENVEECLSREEIRSMVNSGQENGVFNATETEMINNLFEFDDIQADEIMTPRRDVFCIDVNEPLQENLEELMEMRYTRIPVYDDITDNIVGILNMKDFMVEAHKKKYQFDQIKLRTILRKPFFVPENKKVDRLFKEMQKTQQHIAILIDEYGGFSGIVTMEDLIEEITGEIEDEYDEVEAPDIHKIDDHTYILDGAVLVDDLNAKLALHIDNEEFDTLSGFLVGQMGQIPEDDTQPTVNYKNLIFDVVRVKDKRIEIVRLKIT